MNEFVAEQCLMHTYTIQSYCPYLQMARNINPDGLYCKKTMLWLYRFCSVCVSIDND